MIIQSEHFARTRISFHHETRMRAQRTADQATTMRPNSKNTPGRAIARAPRQTFECI
jgi:hypothetical protein